MGFQISPGVNVSEIDLTGIVPAVSTTDGGFCGVFRWGPLNEIVLIGDEGQLVQKFGKPDDDTAVSFFTAANFLAYGNKLHLVRVADTLKTINLNKTVSTSGTTLTSTSLLTGIPRVRPGDAVVFGTEERIIVEVQNDTTAIIDEAFNPDLVSESVIIKVYDGALNATSEEGTGTERPGIGILIKNDKDYESNFSGGLANVGPFIARFPGALGNSLKISLCPSAAAYKQNLAGTVSTSLDDVTVTGSGTAFRSKLVVGSIIKDVVTGQERRVVSIESDVKLKVDVPFKPALGGSSLIAKWEYADAIGIPPSTTEFAAERQCLNDELHVVVVDADGKFSGQKGYILEKFAFLSKASDAKSSDGATIYYVNVINQKSKYIRWGDHLPEGTNWGLPAKEITFVAPAKPYTVNLAGGKDANATDSIDAARINGYDLFKNADEVEISLLLGGAAETQVALHLINNICEVRKDCVVFLSPEKDDVVDNPGYEVEDTIEFRNTLPSSSYAVLDSGWKYQYDRYNDVFRWIPLNGDIAGLCVRTDTERDPWWSPAGYTRGQIKNVIKLAYSPFKAQRDDLYSAGINPVIAAQGQGTLLYGDKTLLAKPSAFDRINVRRLFIVLEKAIARAAKYLLFEFNDEFTRQQFRSLIEPFLRDVQARRGIYDFKVICDSTNNTPEVIDRNEFVGDIYIKPAKSINFIQLNFIAVRTGVEFSEIIGKF